MPAIECAFHNSPQDESMSNPEPGLRRQVMSYSPSMMLVRHRMKKGWVGARHSHPRMSKWSLSLAGTLLSNIPGGVFEAKTGDSFLAPGDVVHQAFGHRRIPRCWTSSLPIARTTRRLNEPTRPSRPARAPRRSGLPSSVGADRQRPHSDREDKLRTHGYRPVALGFLTLHAVQSRYV